MSGITRSLQSWLGAVRGNAAGSSRLTDAQKLLVERLQSYPATPVVHRGPPRGLTNAQAEENLAAFVDSLPQRLESLRNLMEACGVIYPESLTLNAAHHSIFDMHHWAGETWPVLGQSIQGDGSQRWKSGEREGECAIFSVITDIATLLGQIIVQSRPNVHWGVDLDPQNIKDRMDSVKRVVLLAPWQGNAHDLDPVDVEIVVVNRLLRPMDTSERFENVWWLLVEGACRGGYEGVGVIRE